jgi:hypothetical protein
VIKLEVIRPVVYIAILILSVVGTYVYKLRTQGIFACTAEGYYASSDAYLGYCNAEAYGDYDHGAFWFDLEPEAERFAVNADVLFLGSSRMEFALSTETTNHWFSSTAVPHYLLGFSHVENLTFVEPLLARLKPRAKVYVINVDQFFDDVETGPGSVILHDIDVGRRYSEKKLWQPLHRALCTTLRAICGNEFAFFRSREHGHWKRRGSNQNAPVPVADGPSSDQDHWNHYAALAEQFISKLPVDRACVLLTIVPYPGTRSVEAKAIADSVGLELLNPQLEGLRTFDGTHLDLPSAERWSKGFFDIAGPRIRHCLRQGEGETSAVSSG